MEFSRIDKEDIPLQSLNDNLTSHSADCADPTPLTPCDSNNAAGTLILYVIKRNGQPDPYTEEKMAIAMTKAFLAVEGSQASGSSRVREMVNKIAAEISQRLKRRLPDGGSVHIEELQDLVELGLMRHGHQKVARAYVLYREAHHQQRSAAQEVDTRPAISVLERNGDRTNLALSTIDHLINWACADIADINAMLITQRVHQSLYDGMKSSDVIAAMVMSVRTLIETEPGYSFVCARLLLNKLWTELVPALSLSSTVPAEYTAESVAVVFKASIERCVSLELLSESLLTFDLDRLAAALKPERDKLFTYLGLQTLYDRYFISHQQVRLELPQTFFMRVAMGLALNEDDPNERAIEFYEVLSSFDYMTSTPTLFNAGTRHSQLSSCYLTTVPDDLGGIYNALKDNALLSKWAGGLGNDWTPVRALGAHIKGTNGESQGVVPFLKVVNDTAVAVNQGGKRKGAVCAYLETWHLDIEEFLELRKNTGDERRRTHDMNTANWIPDLFMKRVFNDEKWTLFSPDDVSDLHDLFGQAFEEQYAKYEAQAARGDISLHKTVSAKELWRKMLSMLFETGHPWITFKDACNVRSPQQHCGVVHSSNLCTEIALNTSADEIAVCNLGSINLANHIDNGQLNSTQLRRTIETAVRMLDNVIDLNFYAVDQARQANLQHRPVGLGIMGFQDALYALKIPYASVEAVQFADQSMELISFHAIRASALLAKERGEYASYEGSLWYQGILPIDSLGLLAEGRGNDYCTLDAGCQLDWSPVRELVKRYGMRNSNVMAIAPTATISNIVGVTQSIEPTYQNLYVKSNLSGEFTVINPSLVKVLKEQGLWDEVMVSDLKYYDGELSQLSRVPEDIQQLFATVFEIDSRWLIEAASRRQKWLDQAQSLNLYLAQPSGKMLDNLYKLAWSRGLKTTYYLRSLGATHIEKSDEGRREANMADNADTEPGFCSILDPECEACQ
ncbi:MAG: ribonucleoside-diphosphate reductase subunit alpha [Hahellaceae bacterium]|nr:ribonucleoside-diphosphate reductase subunit alpha [Hahellaceae bacterium]